MYNNYKGPPNQSKTVDSAHAFGKESSEWYEGRWYQRNVVE